MTAHAFNPSARETVAGGPVSSRSAWATERAQTRQEAVSKYTSAHKQKAFRQEKQEEINFLHNLVRLFLSPGHFGICCYFRTDLYTPGS